MIIIGGLGRCGTTLIENALQPRKCQFVRHLNPYSNLQNDGVVKTHSLPPVPWMKGGAKAIWMFGNPMDIVVSCLTATPGFIVAHCDHLGGDSSRLKEIYDYDVLGLDKHFDAWYNSVGGRLATVKYETMFSHLDDIQAFMGIPMKFSDYRPRTTDWRRHWAAPWLSQTYKILAEKIEDAEEFKIW